MFEYIDIIKEKLDLIDKYESDNIKLASKLISEAIISKKSIYIFGASHAGILTQEMFYRAGGMVTMNPILPKELSLSNSPITITSDMERLKGYGKIILNSSEIKKGDVLISHSVSGRNPVSIEMATISKEIGVKNIIITNLKYSKSVTSRDGSGKLLYELADVLIDNHGDIGDASIKIEEGLNVSPTSTVIGATILNTIVSIVAKQLKDENVKPLPFFYSANLDGGDEKNREVIDKYKDQIHYKF